MGASTESTRRYAAEQAAASTRIEGHVPTPEWIADTEAVVQGALTEEEARARSLARAIALDRAAAGAAADAA